MRVTKTVADGDLGVHRMTCGKCSEFMDRMRAKCEKRARQMMQSDIGRHLLGADREILLAAKAMIDAKVKWLDSLQHTPAESAPTEESI
jgi:hypothetical protein